MPVRCQSSVFLSQAKLLVHQRKSLGYSPSAMKPKPVLGPAESNVEPRRLHDAEGHASRLEAGHTGGLRRLAWASITVVSELKAVSVGPTMRAALSLAWNEKVHLGHLELACYLTPNTSLIDPFAFFQDAFYSAASAPVGRLASADVDTVQKCRQTPRCASTPTIQHWTLQRLAIAVQFLPRSRSCTRSITAVASLYLRLA